MPSADIIPHGMTTKFEELFHKALEASKPTPRKYSSSASQVYTVKLSGGGEYEFSILGDLRQGPPKMVFIAGPYYGRASKPQGEKALGHIDILTGKLTSYEGGKTKQMLGYAVDQFLHNHKIARDLLGWDVLVYDGWAAVLKRKKSGGKKEIALIAAEMPGRKLLPYTPDGKRRLTYEEERKAGIPTQLFEQIRKKFEEDGVWSHLYKTYLNVNRRVSAWEDGPGEKHFKK